MSRQPKSFVRPDAGLIEVKSKFDAEFRRFAVVRESISFEEFNDSIEKLHGLQQIPFFITYTDPEGDLLPINNDDNYMKALSCSKSVLRLCVQRKGQSMWELNGFGTLQKKKNPIFNRILASEPVPKNTKLQISLPEDFRRVSAIIDVDIIPESHRRVKLMKNGSDKPLGFYIRDGTSVRVTPHGLEKVPAIFISRLVPGGLAESTGLLAVNDEVLEVNGIEVSGKSLDQVTDMMVANSGNLIITVKPVNQRNNISPARGASGRLSQNSSASYASARSAMSRGSNDSDNIPEVEEQDDVKDYISANSQVSNQGNNIQNKQPEVIPKTDVVTGNSERGTSKTEGDSTSRQEDSGRDSPVVTL